MIARSELHGIRALHDYSDEELDLLLAAGALREWPMGGELCRQDAVGAECFLVLRGAVGIYKHAAAGEQRLEVAQPGAILGQMALIGRTRRTATLRAEAAVAALVVARDTYELLLEATSPIALRIQRHIAMSCVRQLRGASARLADVLDASEPPPPIGSEPPPAASADRAREAHEAMMRFVESTPDELGDLDTVVAVKTWDASKRRPGGA